ncbi:superfamily II DNA or RNA helicase [Actinocorallia herbida]|uniref:Superfamily II DNA or RNA helicase n=1 Tax=Actinocorallia herbida TaxID=58109 RepID=A0A3N1CP60_9ACTN|nr:DUF3427 domain-containing protein [Actinocorallia herbida]ROO82944.1 superfamily II DNA or RNA helicase [Actinocorallia herbida]
MTDLAPGVYEQPITEHLQERLGRVDTNLVHRRDLEESEAVDVLVKHVALLVRQALKVTGEASEDPVSQQVEVANRIGAAIADVVAGSVREEDHLAASRDVLLEIAAGVQPDGTVSYLKRPDIPFSSSALLVNGRDQPKIGPEVIKELASADQVDLLCAFLKWQGLRLIESALKSFLDRGGKLRIITTTYMGATDKSAVDRLVELGAELRISYDVQRTRLHAKAWLFRRSSTLDTAYIGSSNLSRSAMLDGLEWNVRLARAEHGPILETFAATFDEYWNDPSFEPYDHERDGDRLTKALSQSNLNGANKLQIANIDVTPYGYQQEILDELEAARVEHGHWRNLVVMATGTGKTIVAALDYKRLLDQGKVDSLLFVAHTKEILLQSLHTFRTVLKDGSFGELFVDGQRPHQWKHVFASIQSLNGLTQLAADQFDMVIVDEFHHAAAKTYANLLDQLSPKSLLGLTATPERTDGASILHWFDGGAPTVELRLWEALEQGLLAPFHYFGIHDDVDLSSVAWRRGAGYDVKQLEDLYTSLDTRVSLIVQAVQDKLGELDTMKAVGFCVSIKHAEYMADRFNQRGIPAQAVTSAMTREQRENALVQLRDGSLKAVFTVDLFNEGVDVPSINTVLFLRPTNSATVFLQQLGRGLRITRDKPVLTVLDFVGTQRKEFRFDRNLSALTGVPRGELEDAVKDGFPTLPAGCAIDLDREVSKSVLASIKHALSFRRAEAVAELRALDDPSLSEYLQRTGRELEDLYGGTRGGWARLRREAGLDHRPVPDGRDDDLLGRTFSRMLHLDDRQRITFLKETLEQPTPPSLTTASPIEQRLLAMLHALMDSSRPLSEFDDNVGRLWDHPSRREELIQVTDVLLSRIHRVMSTIPEISHLPLRLHARYSKDEILSSFGIEKPRSWVQGIRWVDEEKADLFFVTINKTGKGFKPSTMYNDRAITPQLFQWESQSETRESSRDGQRYIHHVSRGSTVHLFLRETKAGAPPYLYAGPMTYLSHEGERPMRILWELRNAMPADVFHYAKVTAG